MPLCASYVVKVKGILGRFARIVCKRPYQSIVADDKTLACHVVGSQKQHSYEHFSKKLKRSRKNIV